MTDTDQFAIAQRRAKILGELAHVASPPPTLVAVSKRQPDSRIDAALAAGQRVFGENRVREAEVRWASRRAKFRDLELRLVGSLQSNKAEAACALFDTIETLDRPKLARALAAAFEKTERRPRLLVQVNTGEEPQKGGVAPPELESLLDLARETCGLSVQGLMCIPPADEPAAPHFALIAKLAHRHGLGEVSMGMSGDYPLAAELGATHVRVGTAFFGLRPEI